MLYIIQKSDTGRPWKLTETASLPIVNSEHVVTLYFDSLLDMAKYISRMEKGN